LAVSPTIGYRLLARWRADGKAGLADRSRRPQHSPGRRSAAMEALVLTVRDAHPAWSGRKIRRRLQDLKHQAVPSASTITAILHRHGRIQGTASAGHRLSERFERAAPNELWQMDYKGHFATRAGRCHSLTMVDDHSRYAIGLQACGDEREGTVQSEPTAIFRRYGLPERMLMDNGAPRGSDAVHRHTWLTLGRGLRRSSGRAASDRPGWLLRCPVLRSSGRRRGSARGGAVSRSPRRSPRWVHRDLPRSAPPDSWRSLRYARVPPVDYRDELRLCQSVNHVPEHPSTMSPASTPCGRGALR
jgi:hypothetical protein